MTLPGNADLIAAFEARDAARIASLYAEDAAFFTPGRPPVSGRAAIEDLMVEDLRDPGFGLTLTEQKSSVSASGDLAYIRGTFSASFTNPQTQQVQSVDGYYLQVLSKDADGSWKVLEDISSPGASANAGA